MKFLSIAAVVLASLALTVPALAETKAPAKVTHVVKAPKKTVKPVKKVVKAPKAKAVKAVAPKATPKTK
jgi:hypothetical protein